VAGAGKGDKYDGGGGCDKSDGAILLADSLLPFSRYCSGWFEYLYVA
jgi:hypothetical protein